MASNSSGAPLCKTRIFIAGSVDKGPGEKRAGDGNDGNLLPVNKGRALLISYVRVADSFSDVLITKQHRGEKILNSRNISKPLY